MGTTSSLTDRRGLLALAGGAGLAGLAAGLGHGETEAGPGSSIVGAWIARFTIAGRSAPPTESVRLFAFLPGGVLISSWTPFEPADPRQGSADEYTGACYGVWEELGEGRYAFSMVGANYTRDVTFSGFEEVWGEVTLDPSGNRWTGRRAFQESAADGTIEILQAEPLPFTATRVTLRRV